MEEYYWAKFLQGCHYGALIKISNAKELAVLQKLAKRNKLFYHEWFINKKYKEILHILDKQTRPSRVLFKLKWWKTILGGVFI